MNKSDQRKKTRLTLVATAVVKPDSALPPVAGYVINISYGGIGLYLNDPVKGRVQTTINLQINRKRIPVTISGRVTWQKSVGMLYAVGISFEGLNPEDHGVLLSFLESFQPLNPEAWAEIDTSPSWLEGSTRGEETVG